MSGISTIGVSATCADDGVTNSRACWLEDPWTGNLRVTSLVLEGLRFLPTKMSSRDGALWPIRGFSDGGACAINRPLLLIVGGGTLGACQIVFKNLVEKRMGLTAKRLKRHIPHFQALGNRHQSFYSSCLPISRTDVLAIPTTNA